MHKYFANTLFLGKKVIYLPECHSTNVLAMDIARTQSDASGHTVYTDYQTTGKGQKGNAWISEAGKNLLCSVIIKPDFLEISKTHLLNIVTCLALRDALNRQFPKDVFEIKWPNDIYVRDKKICGILVETSIAGRNIETAVLGFGLNVNQQHFGLLNATSLLNLGNKEFNRWELLENILKAMEQYLIMLKSRGEKLLLTRYHEYLRWKNEKHYFSRSDGVTFYGLIVGIDHIGKLIIQVAGQNQHYDVKEVSFLD